MAAGKKQKEPIKPPTKIDASKSTLDTWLDEVQDHEQKSQDHYKEIRQTWDDKESILLAKVEDEVSKSETENDVYDPILGTMVIERAARVMAQNPSGKAWAVSKDDKGKNIAMNMLLKHYRNNANEDWSHLVKLRLMDVYSMVYGSMFALVPWRVNLDNGFIGPEFMPIQIRNVRPQPHKVSPNASDWFGVKEMLSPQALLQQDPEVWNMPEINALVNEMREDKDEGDSTSQSSSDDRSYVEEDRFPTAVGDLAFPQIEAFTEYRKDAWVTWTPKRINSQHSRPHILRVVETPYPEGMLPIVKKDAFPLIDSMIGLGEFERGKTLQFALNSLWNLYLVGVKQSIFPPLHIDPNNVVASSIKWGVGEQWFMNNPNRDVQVMNMTPQGLNTFQNTYNYMQSALSNMFGTTQVSSPVGSESSIGRTPEAIKTQQFRESARDEWDRFMMEETMKDVYKRWTALIVDNLELPQVVRLFGPEIKDVQDAFPEEDVYQIFNSGERGNLTVDKTQFIDVNENFEAAPVAFDFEIDAGSTLKRNPEEESAFLQALLDTMTTNPELLDAIRKKNKDIDFGELVKRILMGSPVKDWEKILVELSPQEQAANNATPTGEVPTQGMDPRFTGQLPTATPAEVPTEEVPSEVAPAQVPPTPDSNGEGEQFEVQDPRIAEAISNVFNRNQIPPTAAPAV